MLEYLAYKKFKAHKEKKELLQAHADYLAATPLEDDTVVLDGQETVDSKGKEKVSYEEPDAISESDERFLERNLGTSTTGEAPMTLRQRIATVTSQWHGLRGRNQSLVAARSKDRVEQEQDEKLNLDKEISTALSDSANPSTNSPLTGRSRPVDAEEEILLPDDPLADEESQRTQLQKLLDAFSMNLSSDRQHNSIEDHTAPKTLSERMSESLRVSTFNARTRDLLSEFVQILKDIQNGVPLAGQDLLGFFDKHASDLKTANESVPSFIKTLVLKLLPFSAIPSIEELSKPGALMGLIKGVLQVLKTRFPAFVGGSVLTVMAVVVVMLGLFYAFKRGREERETQEVSPFSRVSGPAVSGLDRGRQVEISVDGVRYVTVLDEDGMRIPCPEDDRGVYWDTTSSTSKDE